jgi:hypothetical protein
VGLRADLLAVLKINSQPLPGFQPPVIQPVVQRIITELSRLLRNNDDDDNDNNYSNNKL